MLSCIHCVSAPANFVKDTSKITVFIDAYWDALCCSKRNAAKATVATKRTWKMYRLRSRPRSSRQPSHKTTSATRSSTLMLWAGKHRIFLALLFGELWTHICVRVTLQVIRRQFLRVAAWFFISFVNLVLYLVYEYIASLKTSERHTCFVYSVKIAVICRDLSIVVSKRESSW